MNISDADVAGHVGSKSELSVGNNAMSAPSGNGNNSKAVRPNIWINLFSNLAYCTILFLTFILLPYRIALVHITTGELIRLIARSRVKTTQFSLIRVNNNRTYRTKEAIDKMLQVVWQWHLKGAYLPKCNNTTFHKDIVTWVIVERTIIEMRIFFVLY